jgi:putative ATP-binding cassette transporter
MKLVELIRKESAVSFIKLSLIAVLAGLTQAFVLALISTASQRAAKSGNNIVPLLLFSVALIAHILSQKYIMQKSVDLVEGVLYNIRRRVADKIRNSELQAFEKIGRSRIYSNITKETITISQAASPIVIACQSGIMVLFALVYLAWLSLAVFLATVILAAVGISIHVERAKERRADMQKGFDRENEFIDLLTHLLDGFKEVKMSTARSADLAYHMQKVSAEVRDLKILYGHQFAVHFIFSQTAFYVLIAVIVFFLPYMAEETRGVVVQSAAAILFIVGPLSNFIGSIPAFANANVAAENITALESDLDKGHEGATTSTDIATLQQPLPSLWLWSPQIKLVNQIEFERVKFHYFDRSGIPTFSIGPLDLTLRAGETVFIVGGNGSGKSSFLKLLTALYFPMGGRIKIDGVDLEDKNRAEYRDMFSVIFADYHLFERPYGVHDVDDKRVQELLKEMEMESKTDWVDDRFTNLDLSTGQRKRLALLMSFLEDKPIYVFDEWAADQDPSFRRYFYEVILKELKNRGKTVIAATHDEKYFGVADRVLKMEYGNFIGNETENGKN